ncbi:TspO/MBR family protein [Magnetovibrio blakemorei]|uniref:TspO protein n=1 Tax=Magnetovibrio blakemorei TaxID=28181 RepID=A0A1E5QBW7_9PROT|nr:TspO/MBR family protein [Magnetovibrio blakemorei]OEJ69484.1 TspO protein [Magnetovibrio blakemorei]
MENNLSRRRDILGLVAFIIGCLVVSGIGGIITATSVGSWYLSLEKPPFNPPNWVFAPVWTTIYVFMAVAGWRVWRRNHVTRHRALMVFGVQLGLNLTWSFLFFGLQRIDLAMIEIFVLLIAIVTSTVLFWRIDRLAGTLFVPYVLWVSFATLLNGSLWVLNIT